MTRKWQIIFFLITLFLLSIPLKAIGKDSLWEKKINAQIEFQNELANLLLRKIPEARQIILIQRDLQLTMIDMQREKYYYLLDHAPSRIIRNQGLSRWSNFKWTDEDEKNLLKINENYRNLRNKKELLTKKNQGHPSWPLVRSKFLKIRESQEYQEIYKQLMSTLKEIEVKLKNTK